MSLCQANGLPAACAGLLKKKPHIRLRGGVWVCEGVHPYSGVSAYSPKDAYGEWRRLNLARIIQARMPKGEQPCTIPT